MKTIFILLPIGFSVRNVLFTGVVDRLLMRADTRVVVFTNIPDIASRYPVDRGRLIFEGLPPHGTYTASNLVNRALNARFDRMFDATKFSAKAEKRESQKRLNRRRYLFDSALSMPFPRSRLLYEWLRALQTRWPVRSRPVKQLFAQYCPNLVFATHPTRMFEYDFLKLARSRGIPTIGMIHSWDVLSTKGRIIVPCDQYFVWNRTMQAELGHFFRIPEDQVRVTGIPQFDRYAAPPNACERKSFLRGQGLDPTLPTVVYATSPTIIAPDESEVLSGFLEGLGSRPGRELQVLVRVHPQDFIERYNISPRTGVAFQVPGAEIPGLEDRRLLGPDDIELLRKTLKYAAVVVNTFSTITIDSAAAGTPVVTAAFDGRPRDYYDSVRRIMDRPHFRPVVESRATAFANDPDELVGHVLRYIENPELHRVERKQLAESMCFRVDGRSAERIATYLQETLDRAGSERTLAR